MSQDSAERRAGQLQDQQTLMLDAVKTAVRAGVDLKLRNAEGETALDFARERRYDGVVA